jgi:hypothetical protein
VALDGGDHRLGQQPPGWSHRALAEGIVALALAGSGDGQIESGAECPARPGQHRYGGFGIGLERIERGPQLQGGLGIDRIALLRAIDRDGPDRAVGGDIDFAHLGFSSAAIRSSA